MIIIKMNFFFFAPDTYKDYIETVIELYKEKGDKNFTVTVDFYSSNNDEEYAKAVESVLLDGEDFDSNKKDSDNKRFKYDGVFYNFQHIGRFDKYLLNMKKIITMQTLESYKEGITELLGYMGTKLDGIPFIVHYGVLYYNKALLDFYHKEVPNTWKDLTKTAQFIVKKVRLEEDGKLNSMNVIPFVGNLGNTISTINSLEEMIYSFRTTESYSNIEKIPNYTFQEAKEAFEMMEKLMAMKDTRGSENKNLFEKLPSELVGEIDKGNILFARTYHYPPREGRNATFALLPGKYSGESASALDGYHIGIPKYINEDKRKKGLSKILDFFFSEDIQRKLVIKYGLYTAYRYNGEDFYTREFQEYKDYYSQQSTSTSENKVLKEDNVCKYIDCELVTKLQFFKRSMNYYDDKYNSYAEKYQQYIRSYFFEHTGSLDEVLPKLEDLTRIYDVELSSSAGSLTIIMLGIIAVIMGASYLLMFDRKYNVYFMFLNNTYWAVFLIGTIMILMYGVISLGEVTQNKCNLRFMFLSLGVPISFSPLLLRLIVLYPQSNKISEHVNRNFSNYLCCHILFELLLCTLYLLAPFEVTYHLGSVNNGLLEQSLNFKSCDSVGVYNKTLLVVNITEKGLEILAFAILIFAEWNIKATKSDIISLTFAIVFDILSFGVYALFYFKSHDDRYAYYYVKVIPVLLFGLSNFFFIYLWKFAVMFTSEKEDIANKEAYLQKKTNVDNIRNMGIRMSVANPAGKPANTNSNGVFTGIVKCHYDAGHASNGSLAAPPGSRNVRNYAS